MKLLELSSACNSCFNSTTIGIVFTLYTGYTHWGNDNLLQQAIRVVFGELTSNTEFHVESSIEPELLLMLGPVVSLLSTVFQKVPTFQLPSRFGPNTTVYMLEWIFHLRMLNNYTIVSKEYIQSSCKPPEYVIVHMLSNVLVTQPITKTAFSTHCGAFTEVNIAS